MSLLLDKYIPKKLEDFIINKEVAKKLKTFCNRGSFMNILITGKNGVGKYTLAMALLHEYYGMEVFKKKNYEYKIKVGTNIKEISIIHSNYHYEIFVNNYLFNDKVTLIKLINNIAENKNVQTNSYNVILIKNFEDLSKPVLLSIKNIMEAHIDTCRFIFISNNNSKFSKIKPIVFNLIVPKPKKDEITEFMVKYSINSNIDSDILPDLFNHSEIKNIHKGNYKSLIETELNKFIQILEKKSLDSILKIREQVYVYCCNNFEKKKIFSFITKYYCNSQKIDDNKKMKIVECACNYEYKLSKSYREIIHIEAFLVNILKILIDD